MDGMEMDFDQFFEDDGDHTEIPDETEETNDSADTGEETATGDGQKAESADNAENQQTNEEKSQDAEPFLTINHLGEHKGLTQEEAVAFAQKGADYDRVKQQLADSRKELDAANEKIRESAELLDLLDQIAKDNNTTREALADSLYFNAQKAKGISEGEARKARELSRLQKKIDSYEAAKEPEETIEQRASREVQEFRKEYPNVELSEELIGKLTPMVQSGKSMLEAYKSIEMEQMKRDMEALKKELAAERQNAKNQSSAMGSQKDSGGARNQDVFDNFLKDF